MGERCEGDFAETVERAREEVWVRIPGWFGLRGAAVEVEVDMREGCE
jgi:hypothetical protein